MSPARPRATRSASSPPRACSTATTPSINIMRRILQAQGAEVVHLGHDRCVEEVVDAAVQEDVAGRRGQLLPGRPRRVLQLPRRPAAPSAAPATSRCTAAAAASSSPRRSRCCAERGVTIFSPEDGQRLGLAGMINELIAATATSTCAATGAGRRRACSPATAAALARAITGARGRAGRRTLVDAAPRRRPPRPACPVLGITGTGGSGKSSLTDELVRRLRRRPGGQAPGRRPRRRPDPAPGRRRAARRPDPDERPRRRRRVFFRSLATRGAGSEVPEHLDDVIAACKAAGFDLVIVETPGIGQGDAAIVPVRRRRRCT